MQVYKDYTRGSREDLEISVSFLATPTGGGWRAHVVEAHEKPIVTQVFFLATCSDSITEPEILARLNLEDQYVSEEACPAIAEIVRSFEEDWLAAAPETEAGEIVISLHPRVVRIAERSRKRATGLRTERSSDPAFQWAVQAVSEIRRCLPRSLPSNAY